MIFTYVAAFEIPEEIAYLRKLEQQFTTNGGTFYFVELSADLNTRLERNISPHRMEMKASKRDTSWSEKNLLKDAGNHELNTAEDVVLFENHLKIDNTHLSPDEVADRIIHKFNLVANEKDESEYRFGV